MWLFYIKYYVNIPTYHAEHDHLYCDNVKLYVWTFKWYGEGIIEIWCSSVMWLSFGLKNYEILQLLYMVDDKS